MYTSEKRLTGNIIGSSFDAVTLRVDGDEKRNYIRNWGISICVQNNGIN